jgi:hypothetical protein
MALKFVQTGGTGGSGSGSGTYDHNLLVNRGMPDQHTIESITGLRTALSKKYEKPFSGIPKTDLAFDVATLHDLNIFRNTELSDVISDLSSLALEVEDARGGLDTLRQYIDTKVSYSEWSGNGGSTGGGGHVNSQVGYPIYQEFKAVESQRVFALSKTYQMGTRQLEVYLNGLRMRQDDDYIESDEQSIEFLYDLEQDDDVLLMVRAVINSGLHEEHVATQDQTIFTLQNPYGIGQNILQIFRNGSLQRKGRDYREIDEYTVEFVYPLQVDDYLTFHQAGATDPIAGTILESELGRMKINHGYTTLSLQETANLTQTDYLDMYIDPFITDSSINQEDSFSYLFVNQGIEVGNATTTIEDQEDFQSGVSNDVDINTYPDSIVLKNLDGGAETHSFSSPALETDIRVLNDSLAFTSNRGQDFFFFSEEIPAGQCILRVKVAGAIYDLNTTAGSFFALAADEDSDGNIRLVYHEQGNGASKVHYLAWDQDIQAAVNHLQLSDGLSDAMTPDIVVDASDVAHVVFSSKRTNATYFNIDYRSISDDTLSGFVDATLYTTSDALNPRMAIDSTGQIRIVFESVTMDGLTKNIRCVTFKDGIRTGALWITNTSDYGNVQPDIHIDLYDKAHIVWRSKRLETTYGIDYCTLSPQGTVGAVKSIATGTFTCAYPRIETDYEGIAHIVFHANYVRSDHENLCYAYVYPDGTVTAFEDVASQVGKQFTDPDIRVHGGRIIVGFLGDQEGYSIVKSLANYTGMGRFDYTFDSKANDSQWRNVISIVDTPAGTNLSMEYRVSNDKVIWSEWKSTGLLDPSTPALGRYLHVRATLTSTDPKETPIMYDMTASYRPSFIKVQSVSKDSSKEPGSAIAIAKYEGDVTFEISRDGGTTFVDAEIDKSINLIGTPMGQQMLIQAKITDGSRLEAWGLLW